MDWGNSYTSKWRVMYVDPNTWADLQPVYGIESVSITRSAADDVPLLESAEFKVLHDIDEDFPYGWYRLELVTDQNGSVELTSVGTFLVDRTSEEYDYNRKLTSLKGHSVLYPVSRMMHEDGAYIPRGMDGPEWCKRLIDECLPFGLEVNVVGGGFRVNDYVVYSSNDSYLKTIWGILDTSGWCLQVDGNGNIYVKPIPDNPTFVLDHYQARILHPNVHKDRDLSDIPNVFKVITDDEIVVVENNDPADISEVSIPARLGMRFVEQETNPVMIDGESGFMYAKRRLRALSVSNVTLSYSHEYVPLLLPFEKVGGYIKGYGPVEEMMVERQTLNCDEGIYVEEEASIAEELWSGDVEL